MNIENLLTIALDRREPLLNSPETDSFRLFNTEGDGLDGLTIDIYGGYLLVQYFLNTIRTEAEGTASPLEKILLRKNIFIKGILIKDRTKRVGEADVGKSYKSYLLAGAMPPIEHDVLVNGVRARVDLVDGQNSGLFLDMREVRDRLKNYYAAGGSMLNLFSYTGIFSVHGLANGLDKAVNVDLSGAVLKRARINYNLNSLRVDSRDFVNEDSIKYIKFCEKKGITYDFAVFDPPSFARNKSGSFSAARDFSESLNHLGGICRGGLILTSINSRSISREEYLSAHPKTWKNEFFANEPADFPFIKEPYLKAGLWRVA